MMVWLMVLLADCDQSFGSFQTCSNGYGDRSSSSAEVMSAVMAKYFSWVLLLFLIAQSMPLFAEMWIERSFKMAAAEKICALSVLGTRLGSEIFFRMVGDGRFWPTEFPASKRALTLTAQNVLHMFQMLLP
jgi:hypothetical protein